MIELSDTEHSLDPQVRTLIRKNLIALAAIEALLSMGGCAIKDLKLHVQDAVVSPQAMPVAKPVSILPTSN